MGTTQSFISEIRESVSVNGLGKTKTVISRVLKEYREPVPESYHCNYCKGDLVCASPTASSILLYSCDVCDNEIVVYNGTVRTKRRSGGRRFRSKITIRCVDEGRKERVIECYSVRFSDRLDIEMKSGDKFSIMFFRINNDELGIQAEIENKTVKKAVSARVDYEDLVEFAESLSVAKDSYLKRLPEGLVPSA